MYGTPYGEYELKGIISDKETAKPIQNIQIVRQYWDTLYTDSEGKYSCHNMSPDFHLKIEDIDSVENGGYFKTQEIEIELTQADQVEKGKGWYRGKNSKTVNIKLEKK
jgi:putative lipoprotein (rSAM/lipoprotein system)